MASTERSAKASRTIKPLVENNINEDFLVKDQDVVWIHNKTNTEFHVPPLSLDPKTILTEDITKFEMNDCLPFNKHAIQGNKNLLKCIQLGRLEIFSQEQYEKWKGEKARLEKKERKSKAKGGLYEPSGLPADWKLAVQFVSSLEDLDVLEGLTDTEDREVVALAIQSRIDELEGVSSDED